MLLTGDGERLTLIIDEVLVLARAMEDHVPGTGSDLLIMLRRIRQEPGQQLAMLLMGSMGFHHVSADSPGAVNDVIKEAVGPIATADAVASQAENVPFYIQNVVKDARDRFGGQMLKPSMVTELVDSALNDGDASTEPRASRDRAIGPGPRERTLIYERGCLVLVTGGP